MSRWDESGADVLAAIAAGANLREACERTGTPYSTARTWIAAGRRDPEGPYGAWVQQLDAAKGAPADGEAGGGANPDPGPVELRLTELLGNRELTGETALAAEQARALARTVDRLGETRGGAAAMALATCTRRLEEVIPGLAIPREDAVDRLRQQRDLRRLAAMQSGSNGRS